MVQIWVDRAKDVREESTKKNDDGVVAAES